MEVYVHAIPIRVIGKLLVGGVDIYPWNGYGFPLSPGIEVSLPLIVDVISGVTEGSARCLTMVKAHNGTADRFHSIHFKLQTVASRFDKCSFGYNLCRNSNVTIRRSAITLQVWPRTLLSPVNTHEFVADVRHIRV